MKMTPSFVCLLMLAMVPALAQDLPEGFYDVDYVEGLDYPVGLTFDDNGRMYIWEKKGVVRVADAEGNLYDEPLIDISEEVSNWKDHGLMGFTLDNDFLANGYFYLLYALDLHHYEYFGTPAYHPDTTVTWAPTIGRVVRYRADPTTAYLRVLEGSRKVLLGEALADGIPLLYEFHGLGSLAMAADGTLLVSSGDATGNGGIDIGGDEFGTMASEAIAAGVISPDQDLGSYRAQYLGNLNGKILRIDAETGEGLRSNPYYEAEAPRSAASRTWALGLRNPYRIHIRPNTGSHYPEDGNPGAIYIGDVGNGAWEELNIATQPGQNFGWPIMEGLGAHWPYFTAEPPPNQLRPNPLYGNGCDEEFFDFKDLYVNPRQGGHTVPPNPCNDQVPVEDYMVGTMPALLWSNAKWNPPTRAQVPVFDEQGFYTGANLGTAVSGLEGAEVFDGFSSLAGAFYEHEHFPEQYRGKYFMVDFSGWIKVADFDEQQRLLHVEPFHGNARDIIHLAANPADGKLYYIGLDGKVHQISFGGNPPPVADIGAEQFFGAAPLTVDFDASASYDTNLPLVAYHWDFGDGQTAEGVNVSHTFTGSGSYMVKLTVADSLGAEDSDEAVVSLDNTPPQVRISSFEDGWRYPLDQGTTLLPLIADVADAEHSAEELTYQWRTFLHHNDHFHPDPVDFNPRSFALISPLGCQEELYWYRTELTVADPGGLSTTVVQRIYPYCGEPFVAWAALEGVPEGAGVALHWETTAEDSMAYYLVERSPDPYRFEPIGQVAATGAGRYDFFDDGPRKGTNNYRVRAVTANGAYRFSNTLKVGFPRPLPVKVFPNPVRSSFTVSVEEVAGEELALELIDMLGKVVQRQVWPVSPGAAFEKEVLPGQLPNGVYHYRIWDGANEHLGTLVLAR